ncbi:hypothetical protein ACFFX0_29350 [Citricoccus parietis]|uniref:Uncharacterized protein n=1 Tax=Citricoccus parietis TaxID=592307 RepID=A0ABV5G4L9_9MICC
MRMKPGGIVKAAADVFGVAYSTRSPSASTPASLSGTKFSKRLRSPGLPGTSTSPAASNRSRAFLTVRARLSRALW